MKQSFAVEASNAIGGSRRALAAGLACAFLFGSVIAAQSQEAYPAKDTEWIVAYPPGSGGDVLARTVISIMKQYDMYPHDMVVTNIEGASGSIGYTRVLQRAGDPYVLTTTSSSFITAPLTADTPWKTADFTPVALVGRDDYIFVVAKEAAFDTFEEFAAAGKTRRLKIGNTSVVTFGYLVAAQVAQAAGYEWDQVPFTENGQMISALFSGAVDAIILNPGDVAGQLETGDLIGIGISSEERLDGPFESIPTFAELGYETTAALPRGIVMPPDVPKEAQDWWANALREVVQKPEWQTYLKQNGTSSTELFGDDWGVYAIELSSQFEEALRQASAQ